MVLRTANTWSVTERTATTLSARRRFRDAVEAARALGWAIENQENESGIACVGIALTSTTSQDVAISVTGPVERMTPERLAEIGALLRKLAGDLAPEEYTLAPTTD